MKYHAHIYAKALAEVISDPKAHGETISRNFLELLKKNGDEASAKKILEEAARFVRGKEGVRKVVVESARPLTGAQRKELGRFLKPTDVVQEEIDPALIAGIRIFLNDEELFDGSLKKKLDAILKIS